MTTLIYRDGELAGDRRYGMPLVGERMIYVDRPKVHLHPSKRIAFGLCGATKGKDVVEELGNYLLTVATLIDKGTIPDMMEVLKDWAVDSLNIILMTKQSAWLIVYEEGMDIKISNLDELPYYTVGSGQWCAAALLAESCTLEKIYEITPKIDGMTGTKFDVYKKNKLKALRSNRDSSNKK